jgi:TnpA family transposase
MSVRESRNPRASGYGGIACRLISGTYTALFCHFISCGVWEAVYLLEGLLDNTCEVQPGMVHTDTQGQSLPVSGLARALGSELLPRIGNWQDLVFCRPARTSRCEHIDKLFAGRPSTGT